MGQSKGSGYEKLPTQTNYQNQQQNQILGQAVPAFQQAAQGYQQFLPGGGGGKAIADAAQNRFQQQTLPSILNSFGSGAKSSSALNQALAAGASNLNTDIASQLAQMQLQASQGLGNLGAQAGQLGQKDQFAYLQKPQSGLQAALPGALQGALGIVGDTAPYWIPALGALFGGPIGAAAGGAVGAAIK